MPPFGLGRKGDRGARDSAHSCIFIAHNIHLVFQVVDRIVVSGVARREGIADAARARATMQISLEAPRVPTKLEQTGFGAIFAGIRNA